jgi:hypothetical protein
MAVDPLGKLDGLDGNALFPQTLKLEIRTDPACDRLDRIPTRTAIEVDHRRSVDRLFVGIPATQYVLDLVT